MNLYEIMLNLCIGIVGGIFSSIIVSRIFLINSTLAEQMTRVQERFEKSYGLGGIIGFYSVVEKQDDFQKDDEGKKRLNAVLLNDIHSLCKNEMNIFMGMIFDDLEESLHELAVELNDIIYELSNLVEVTPEKMIEFGARLMSVQNKFNGYKKLSSKIFRRKLWTDKWLRVLAVLFLVFVVITLIA